ncbi:hypothetical protein Hanom_Chr11g01030261 [Helianthus anomalus]
MGHSTGLQNDKHISFATPTADQDLSLCFIVSRKTTCGVYRFLNDWIWEREFSHTPKCRLWLTMNLEVPHV